MPFKVFAGLLAGLIASTALAAPQVPAVPGPGRALILPAAYDPVVYDLQRQLGRLGYDAGVADGLIGTRTRAAIQAYEADSRLLVTGQPSQALLDHVRATVVKRFGSVAPPPAPAPAPSAPSQATLVSDIQAGLRGLGYTVPTTSGRLTEGTRTAIRTYEQDHGLLLTGEPSQALLAHIRQQAPPAAAATPPAADTETIAGIQSELRRRGYDIPTVSGQMDDRTRTAIRQYQQARGLPVTGEPSATLLADLRQPVATAPAAPAVSVTQISAVQRALNERGYEAGPPDGTLGPRTRTALRTFQSDSGLEPSGQLTPQTLERLGVAAPPAGTATPPAPAPAPTGPQYRTVITDAFSDGNYTTNPSWQVAAGSFAVSGGGLTSTTNPPQQGQGVEQIIGSVLQQQLGLALPGAQTAAVAYVPTVLANAFRITVEVVGSGSQPRLDIGPFQGRNLAEGYRLSFSGGQARPLQLLLGSQSGVATIASASAQLGDGRPHTIVWERQSDGLMRVSVDGTAVLEARDGEITSSFSGFSVINGSGRWTIRRVVVEDRTG